MLGRLFCSGTDSKKNLLLVSVSDPTTMNRGTGSTSESGFVWIRILGVHSLSRTIFTKNFRKSERDVLANLEKLKNDTEVFLNPYSVSNLHLKVPVLYQLFTSWIYAHSDPKH